MAIGVISKVLPTRQRILHSLRARSLHSSIGPDRLLPAENLTTTALDGAVKLRLEKDGFGSREPISCYSAIKLSVEKYPLHLAWVDHDRTWTYEQYFDEVTNSARALIELGLEPNKSVAVLGNNSPEWFSCATGAVLAGGVVTGVYTTNTPEAVAYQLKHSQANIAVVDSDIQLQKVLQVRHKLPELKTIIHYGESGTSNETVNWHDFKQLGKTQDTQLKTRLENQAINQPALVVYTSGTTANPKGVLLSQDNLTWLSYSCKEFYNAREGEEIGISYLPVAHVVGQVMDIWLSPIIAATTHFADKDALRGTLVKNLERIKPTRFVGVPRVYEKMQMELEKAFGQATGVKGSLLQWARDVSTEHFDSLLAGGRGSPVKYGLAEKLILGKIHAKLGLDNCVGGVYSGAAPLSMESIQFMKTIGLVVNEIYGMTENATNNANHFHKLMMDPEKIKLGTNGLCLTGTRTKISNPDPVTGLGEIASVGRNVFMGYLGEEEKTASTFDSENWILTGDLGTLENGYLSIQGREKDLIVTSGGKNVASYPIETLIKTELSQFVSNCVVVGDKQNYLACLLTVKAVIDPVTLEVTDELEASAKAWCLSQGCTPESVTDLVANKDKYQPVWAAVTEAINKVNIEAISRVAEVKKFTILPAEFTIGTGEVGPTLKIKRHVVQTKFAKDIEAMYKE